MNLQPGDLMLWRVGPGISWVDRFVGWAQSHVLKQGAKDMQFFHVAFVAANPKYYYSSQPPKIDKFIVPDTLPACIEIWRFIDPLDPIKLANVFQYAESRRGNWYPFLGVLTAGLLQGNLEFCSQYTEDSFAHYPLLLCPNIRFTTPDDIASSPLIQKIPTV